jgi:DNA-binding NtrC family response regulator
MKVLVVDDERAAANSIAEALCRSGHHVLPLYSAIEAVEHAEHLTFDVALIRLNTGPCLTDLGDQLRKLMPRSKMILVFGEPVLGIARELRNDFDYLPKSFKTKDLLKKLEEISVQELQDSLSKR